MKYYLIAGEASGDLHGSNLLKGLRQVDPNPSFRFWGGDRMQAHGGELVKHYREHSIMGFWEVLVSFRKIKRNFRICRQDLLDYNPDVLILIDYPGFNLRMARFAKKHNIPVYYYISPKIWAWKESRIKKIKAFVDRMFIIFPFEKEFYRDHDYPAEYYGNPLIDAIDEWKENRKPWNDFIKEHNLEDKQVVAILPGSRKQEIDRNFSVMLKVIKDFNEYQFVVAGAPSIDPDYYRRYLSGTPVHFVYDKTYELLNHSVAALITSGTATLEAALFNVPQVVCYKANPISYRIAKHFVKVSYISLVNLNMQKEVVRELIQDEMNPDNLRRELDNILNNGEYIRQMKEEYSKLRERLGGRGASYRVANAMYEHLCGAKSGVPRA
ncbi:MAG: lipid-A-disaccharide synthase [Bacteroidales bacterium]